MKKKIYIRSLSISNIWKKQFLLNYNLLTKLNISNLNFLPKITQLMITVNLDDNLTSGTDLKIINSLSFLDYFCGKKSGIYSFGTKYIRRQRTIIFVAKSTLINWIEIYKFIVLLKKSIIIFLDRRYMSISCEYFNDGFTFILKDISSLDEVPNIFKGEKFFFKVSFFFKNTLLNKKIIKLIKYIFI